MENTPNIPERHSTTKVGETDINYDDTNPLINALNEAKKRKANEITMKRHNEMHTKAKCKFNNLKQYFSSSSSFVISLSHRLILLCPTLNHL